MTDRASPGSPGRVRHVRITAPQDPRIPAWWPGSPASIAGHLARGLESEGVRISGPEDPDGSVDVEVTFAPDGRFTAPGARLPVVMQCHALPTPDTRPDSVHECWWPARLLQVETGRGYLAMPPAAPMSAVPTVPGLACYVDSAGPGLAVSELMQLAGWRPDWRFLCVTQREPPTAGPPNLEWVAPHGLADAQGYIMSASVLIAGDIEGFEASNLPCLIAAQLAGIPVLAWSNGAGNPASTVIEEGWTGLHAGDVPAAAGHFGDLAAFDRAALAARASERLDARRAVLRRLAVWHHLLGLG